jgi:pimeloyl-ACP methyl ester carboxylesterase
MTIPGIRHTLKGNGFDIPIFVYRASPQNQPLPTLILGNGAQEEMVHVNGFAALEGGYNAITYEGPGHCLSRRQQNKGFIAEWEKVVTPVVDYLQTFDFVDAKRIVILGYSLGGFLCAQVACFERRITTVMCVGAGFDLFTTFGSFIPPAAKRHLDQEDEENFNDVIEKMASYATYLRWAIDQTKWSFMASPYQAFYTVRDISLEGIPDRLECPAPICDAEEDGFFQGQPSKLDERNC